MRLINRLPALLVAALMAFAASPLLVANAYAQRKAQVGPDAGKLTYAVSIDS